jgi:ribosomal protein L11 methylase PrmA
LLGSMLEAKALQNTPRSFFDLLSTRRAECYNTPAVASRRTVKAVSQPPRWIPSATRKINGTKLYHLAASVTMLELTLHIGVGVDASYVGDILVNLGALCVTTRDRNAGTAAEQPIFNEPAPGGDVFQAAGKTPVPWTEAILTAFFPVTTSVEDVSMALLSDFEMPATPNLKIVNSSPVPDHILAKDWVSHVHQNFAAVQIGDLCVRAPWHKTASLDPGVRHELVVEPGQAFGTGEHPTTQLVIGWVRRYADQAGLGARWRVLDYGLKAS